MSILFLDLETNHLNISSITNIWCICTNQGDFIQGEDYEKLRQLISSADRVVGHNIVAFDAPVLRAIAGIEIPREKIIDTILISRLIMPDREGGHSLKAWGKRVGLEKGDFKEFDKFTPEMLEYCRNDVQVTMKTYDRLMGEIKHYDVKPTSLKLEHEFAYWIQKQIEAGFGFDTKKAEELYTILAKESEELYESIISDMPKKRLDSECYKKAKAEGRLLQETETTFSFSDKRGKISTKDIKFELPNPTSRQQVADHLMKKYEWKPTIFTETGQAKVSEQILEGIKNDYAKHTSRLFRLQKQMGMIKDGDNGWLKLVTPEGRLHGNVITNGANTGRCTHSKPNLAQVDAKDKRMRELFIPREGWKLVGVDAKSLEIRLLAHYLAKYDGGLFASEALKESKDDDGNKIDVHVYNQKVMGLNTRNSAKTAFYALVYGAGNEKMGKIKSSDSHSNIDNSFVLKGKGKELRDKILEEFLGYKELLGVVSDTVAQRGYLFGLDGRPLHPRSDYSALNLLIQSAGAIVMKQALVEGMRILTEKGLIFGKDFNLVGSIHDEYQIECELQHVETVGTSIIQGIKNTGKIFSLNCDLDGEMKDGDDWSSTH